ncbi:hypothetical protein [Leptospira idonii]|uniref:Cell shape-determining protein MreB n=1 Tax=Leptospira idonii TaxID=1193500 RepID=A0A4R9M1P0_9LEPT|nr:hypothetical protein [Leptospira idonii]TGN19891.1 hypothetical protein EHS15_06730 [Leptospira idonii]
MKQLLKKGLLVAMLALLAVNAANCKKDKKDDNVGLLLALWYLNQYEATVTLTGALLDTSGIATRDGKVTLTSADPDILTAGQGAISDFTACQTNAPITTGNQQVTNGLDGEFVLNFKINATSGSVNIAAVSSTGASNTVGTCDNIAALSPDTFTDVMGNGTLSINVNNANLSDKGQIVANVSGFQVLIKSVTIVVKGTYNLASPTVGENVCDGRNATSPEVISGDITSAKVVSSSALLSGTVTIKNGGSLTVLPGAVVFGNRGSSLFIQDNGSLIAEGTAASPVCFTSAQNLGSRYPSDWGGIVVIGNGVGTRSAVTEGTTPQSYPRTTNSTVKLKYAIIEFAGNEVAPGDELNGLSSYTVTNSSNYSYVQIHRGLDDGFEWWGGNVPGDHLVVTGGLDDDFDMDEGFGGTLTNILGVKYPAACGGSPSTDPHGMEMDGSHNAGVAPGVGTYTNPTVTNYTLIGAEVANGFGARFREGMRGTFSNGLVYGFASGNLRCDNNAGGGTDTNPTVGTTLSQSGKASTIGSQCVAITQTASLTATPVVSMGNINSTDCGFSATKPDFTTNSGLAQTGAGNSANGKWWDSWTVYRAR